MSAQAVTASIWSPSGGRSFAVNATDGTFANFALSTTGSAQLGFAMTNELATMIQVTYVAGGCAWRIRNSVSQVTKRVGFGYKVGATGAAPYDGNLQPIVFAQDDVCEIYTVAVP
jgi:hypothetical protein